MNALLPLLLAVAVQIPTPVPTTTLILRSGARFTIEGPLREEDGRVIFRTGGALYSIPVAEVDAEATRAAITAPIAAAADSDRKLKVTPEERERLLRALEQNHSGTPAAPLRLENVPEPHTLTAESAQDEWSWRRAARAHEEAIRRAKEEADLLRTRAEKLKHQIEQCVALGYRPNQFSYQTTELQLTLDAMPAAELEITRAQREWDQFRDDARRQGIMPGWLR